MKYLILLNFILLTNLLKAECYYSDYELKLEGRTTDGKCFTGFARVQGCLFNPDSMNDHGHLVRALSTIREDNSLIIYGKRREYRYCASVDACAGSEKSIIYLLYDPVIYSTESISQIKVVDYIQVPSTEEISTTLELSDTGYFDRQPLETIMVGAYLCHHHISVFNDLPENRALLDEIKTLQAEIESEPEIDFNNGEYYDERIWTLINRLSAARCIITVSGCTD